MQSMKETIANHIPIIKENVQFFLSHYSYVIILLLCVTIVVTTIIGFLICIPSSGKITDVMDKNGDRIKKKSKKSMIPVVIIDIVAMTGIVLCFWLI